MRLSVACVCVRERDGGRVCLGVCVRECVCVRERDGGRVCLGVCVCVCVCVSICGTESVYANQQT